MYETKVYRIDSAGIKRLNRRMIRQMLRGLPLMVVGIFVGVFAAEGRLGRRWEVALLAIGSTIMSVAVMLRKQRKLWASFELAVSPTSLVRKQKGYADLEIRKEEATRVEERPRYGLTVRTSDRFKYISVPLEVEGYDHLKEQLRYFAELGPPTIDKAAIAVGVSAVILFMLAHLLPYTRFRRRHAAALAHLLASASFVWLYFEMRRNPQLETKIRRRAWIWVIIVVVAEAAQGIKQILPP